jgi:predicted PurR-regulated permease PerM
VIHHSAGGVSIVVALTAILPELVIAAAAACLLAQGRSRLARRTVPKLAAVLLATMFLTVLYGVGGG